MIPVNKFFAHWIKKIEIIRFADDLQIIPALLIDTYI